MGEHQYGYTSTYGYGNPSGYGYGYGSGGGTIAHRSLNDYLAVLRERVWYIVIALVLTLAAVSIYTFTVTPIYESEATVEIFRRNPNVMNVQQVMDSEVRSAEDLNTQVNILKSTAIIQRVFGRLKSDDLKRFLAPYEKHRSEDDKPLDPLEILEKNRDIVPQRLSLIVSIKYQHADRDLAAKIANLFADEYIAYTAKARVDESLKAVEELEGRANEQRQKVDDMAKGLQAYREKNSLVSLDQRKDISTETLKALNVAVTQSGVDLQTAETRWKQVMSARQAGTDLLTLSFIGADPVVSRLQQQLTDAKLAVTKLSERYRDKHPQMVAAANSLKETQQQLQQAIKTATSQVEASYQAALQNHTHARAALASQEASSLSLDRFGVEYTNMERDFTINEKLLENILSRMRETTMGGTVETQNARLVDRGVPGRKPVSPRVLINLALGIIGGLGLGVALAFFVSYADDRVKSAYDIEVAIGLPLLSIIPRFKAATPGTEESATAFEAPKEPEIAEAFSTLYSSLRLKDEGRTAKCIVITSTVPGEGKSFIARNLALCFASHGEKVLLMDCDLRRPTAHRGFKVDNLAGVIDVCTKGVPLDEVLVKDVRPNLDLLPSGGRSENPAQNLTSRNFEAMLVELRKRYDRIFIDTPPVSLVSDAFVVLPLCDGSIYSIFFNKVRRKAAQFCVQRLLEISVPHFGAVLNGLDQRLGGYYYGHYYDKAYKGYYVTPGDKSVDGKLEEEPKGKR
ncbi:MAG: polysaccharide biosynthesis tyrosine autokinase [Lacunisphaera sp.]